MQTVQSRPAYYARASTNFCQRGMKGYVIEFGTFYMTKC